jgi:hypothetical protein
VAIDVAAPAGRVTIAPHLPPAWDSVRVENVPVGRGAISFTLRRTADAMTLVPRRLGPDRSPVEIVFSPALPLGARTSGAGVAMMTTPGDVHASSHVSLTDSATLTVRFTGGWAIVPPVMPATIGSRSRAPRVLSERLSADDRYAVALEGLSGQQYVFEVRTPDEASARALEAATSVGSSARLSLVTGRAQRMVQVTFPSSGANADGYTTATVTFTRSAKP